MHLNNISGEMFSKFIDRRHFNLEERHVWMHQHFWEIRETRLVESNPFFVEYIFLSFRERQSLKRWRLCFSRKLQLVCRTIQQHQAILA